MGESRGGTNEGQDAHGGIAGAVARRCDLRRSAVQGGQSGGGAIPSAPAAGSFRRDGGDGSLDRTRARNGGRFLLRPVSVQPRHAGLSPAWLLVQADRLFGGARQWLYAINAGCRRTDRNRSGTGCRRLAPGEFFLGKI